MGLFNLFNKKNSSNDEQLKENNCVGADKKSGYENLDNNESVKLRHVLLEILSEKLPNVEDRFGIGSDFEKLNELQNLCGRELPVAFTELYQCVNGEKEYVGAIFGFQLLSLEEINWEYTELKKAQYNILSDKEGQIKEGGYRKAWIPFAHDNGGSFLVLDLEPDINGVTGQVITLDRDNDNSYVLSHGLKELFEKMQECLNDERFVFVKEDAGYFSWKTGHLFDGIDKLLIEESEEDIVRITPYFEQFFKGKVENHCVCRKDLESVKMLFLKVDSDIGYGTVSLEIFQYMTNLKELIIHIRDVESLSPIIKLTSLRKLVIGNQNLTESSIGYIVTLERLNSLTLFKLSLQSIIKIADCKGLKYLSLYNVKGFDYTELHKFTKLTELSLVLMAFEDFNFLMGLKKLKKLEIEKMIIPNLDFIEKLEKLEEFKTDEKAINEDGLKGISKCKNLKILAYPLGDLSIVKECSELIEISIDGIKFCNVNALEETKIQSVMVYNAISEEEAKNILNSVKQHCNISSSGYVQSWD